MARKIDNITELYDSAIKKVSASPENWMAFLQSASRNYRLPFDEQILIHEQRPDATAVLEMKQWNEKFGRWVKRDSKGIAVFDKNAETMRLKYYFDVSDTKEGKYRRLVRPVPLWEVEEKHGEAVKETLENAFGVAEGAADLPGAILLSAGNAAEDNLSDYLGDILSAREDSLLAGMDDTSVEMAAGKILSQSTAYMLMFRCGIDVDGYFEPEDFQGITEFSTPPLINLIGTATSDISEMALSQVADTVRRLRAEEKKQNRTFDDRENGNYNGITKSEPERSPEYGIHETGRLQAAGSERAGRTGSTPWEIRLTPKRISEEREIRTVHNHADAGETKRTLNADTGRSTAEDAAVRAADGTEAGSDGGTQGKRPDGMDRQDEQHPPVSGGSGAEGTDLQLEKQETEKETVDTEKAGDENAPAFSVNERETEILYNVLDRLKIEGIDLSYEEGSLTAWDGENRWDGAEFYRFLADEAFVYEDNGDVLGIPEELVTEFEKLAADYGVEAAPDIRKRRWHDRRKEDKSIAFLSGTDTINDILLATPHLKADKGEIVDFYRRHEDREERTEYIKSIFNDDYTEVELPDGRRAGYKTYENVLHLWEGSYLSRTAQAFYDWRGIAEQFEGMRLLGLLRDKSQRLLSINGQMTLFDEMAAEKAPAFSFTQEIIDRVLTRGSGVSHGKYRIYSYFLQGHSAKEREDFLKKEYGIGGTSSIQAGTGIAEWHDGKGIQLSRSYRLESPEILLKWNKIAKRIDELIEAGRYLSRRETEYLPEYEKDVLANEIYHFFYNQPETVVRPYPYGTEYYEAVKIVRPQLNEPQRVAEIIKSMGEVLENTADFARNYQSMQETYRDLQDYRDGVFSLFTPIPAEKTIPETPLPSLSPPQAESMPAEKAEPESRQEPPEEQTAEDRKGAGTGRESRRRSTAERNYLALMKLAPEVLNGEEDSARFEAGSAFMPLTIERIGENRIAVSHYYVQNGDSLADPDMEFVVDHEEKTLKARTYQQDSLGRRDDVTAGGTVNERLENELNQFASQWFRNIRKQRYRRVMDQEEPESEISILKDAINRLSLTGIELSYEDGVIVADDGGTRWEGSELYGMLLDGIASLDEDEDEKLPPELVEKLENLAENQRAEAQGKKEGIPEQEEQKADLTPAWEKKRPTRRALKGFDLHPEIPQEKRSQYRISNDELGHGTKREKFRANIAAIQLLKKCEAEDRYATPEEQEILSGYVGWGGLPDAFDETNSAWGTEYLELKTVLTEEEYEAARQSTLTAFYTPPAVIRAMYQALADMGLKSGNILEPSCATGNFIGMKPESLSDCKIYGVEVDPISGRIAAQLYQKSTIALQGYEEAVLPDSFFDVAVGNVPFGQFKVSDKRYDRYNFLIHDYFFAKTLDKIRPGGVIAFITSSGTMDKKNPAVRKYIAQRAELLGAIRLPNDAFKKNAGTEVTADILFLQKRDRLMETEPEWLYLDTDENGVTMNRYFVEHPEMVLGEMVMESTAYGMDSTCRPYGDKDLEGLLNEAVSNIRAEISEHETEEMVEEEDRTIPADPSVPNFSFVLLDDRIYYRENSRMKPVELSKTGENRVRGMVAIRDCVRELIAFQTEGYADSVIKRQQEKLNHLYDVFRSRYGLLNARANSMVFADDNSYPLLCSLEILKEDGTLDRKADMFTKRTIKPHETVTRVDTASEALSLSLAEKARVDMEYMCSLTGKTAEEIEKELNGVIFREPGRDESGVRYVAEDEYLSGNVREKLNTARLAAESDELYRSNVEALEKVQPKDLTASEISVRLGTTWIPPKDIEDFMYGLLETPNYYRRNIRVRFSTYTGEWRVEEKNSDKGNVKANNAYGTQRANAYKIIEDTLNLRDTRIYDYIEENGKKKAVLNKEETAIAQGKQELIKQAFQDWIWKEPERRQRLTDYYNKHFNAMRPREYDGSHLHFYGMNPEIKLRQHQKNGAARIIYGGNALLAYVVGAGKTYTMVAAAMESKRLGLCSKSMVVVPNHIIEQFAAEWLQLYPAANILVATKKDFETKNRRKFCARIATGDWDAVIIGHSQFEKIPVSVERQRRLLMGQIEEIMEGIKEAKRQRGSRFSVKQLEKAKKSLMERMKRLNDQSRKDSVVTFEELGIDRLFVDEADNYKNLYLYTKMRNVGGIAQTEALKSSDMFMKCQYLDEDLFSKSEVWIPRRKGAG